MHEAKFISADCFFDLSQFFCRDLFNKISNVWQVLPLLENYLDKKLAGKRILLGKGSSIEESASVAGRALIGKNTQIGHGALLRGDVIIGDDAVIGHACEIKNSLILNKTHVAHLNYVGDSIVGSYVNISGGAMLANFRFDEQKVAVKVEDKIIQTNLQKFGAVIGDHSKIGANAVLNPGTILGKKTIVYPLTMVSGYHPAGKIIKSLNH